MWCRGSYQMTLSFTGGMKYYIPNIFHYLWSKPPVFLMWITVVAYTKPGASILPLSICSQPASSEIFLKCKLDHVTFLIKISWGLPTFMRLILNVSLVAYMTRPLLWDFTLCTPSRDIGLLGAPQRHPECKTVKWCSLLEKKLVVLQKIDHRVSI